MFISDCSGRKKGFTRRGSGWNGSGGMVKTGWNSILKYGKRRLKEVLDHRGAALIELLTALPLAMLVLLAAFSIFGMMLNGFDRTFQQSDQQFYARVLLEQISRDVKESSSAEVLNEGQVLSLKDGEARSVRYYLNRGQVVRSSGGNSIPITENTDLVTFSELSGDTIRVDVEFKQSQTELFISSICTRKH